jgi:hypothetical protein
LDFGFWILDFGFKTEDEDDMDEIDIPTSSLATPNSAIQN